MARHKLYSCEVKQAKTGEYKVCRIDGNDVSIWPNSFSAYAQCQEGAEVEGEIKQNGNWRNLVDSGVQKKAGFGAGMMQKKAEMINGAQEKKVQSINQAQERNERMWALYGASEIVAHHPAYRDYAKHQLEDQINELATKIYRMKIVKEDTPF